MVSFKSKKIVLAESVILARLRAALEWIACAQHATINGGISKGYHAIHRRWSPSYPETTGYTIPTLLNAALVLGRSDLIVTPGGAGVH